MQVDQIGDGLDALESVLGGGVGFHGKVATFLESVVFEYRDDKQAHEMWS
jgi:hypothetical protein